MERALRQSALIMIALAAIFFASPSAADGPPQFTCFDCRNIVDYPEDARNFAINRIFGPESFLPFDATFFSVSDGFGNTVLVNINAEYVLELFDYRLIDDLFVEDLLIQVVLAYPNGDVFRYTYSRKLLDPSRAFPVPAIAVPTEPAPLPGSSPSTAPPEDDPRDVWDFQDEYWADWEEAWGGWHCRPDYSHPNITGVICQPG